ncbi:MAG: tRNA (guanosine(46)-N7)-methyltransferase TrmB [Nevskiaceae bacterium]
MEAEHRREIRSFVRREGRMTVAQKRALEELWPKFGVEPPRSRGHGPLLQELFGRRAPVVMEIGFGNGEHLLARAQAEPSVDFLGVEVHRPGAGRVMNQAQAAGLTNLRVACADAVEVLRDWLPERCLAELVVYFPDPWPKKRHHKRRLVQPAFAALAASRLVPGGLLKLATDWAEYAQHMRATLDAEPSLENLAGAAGFVPRPAERPLTRFEQRGMKLGHEVFDLVYRRVG